MFLLTWGIVLKGLQGSDHTTPQYSVFILSHLTQEDPMNIL